MKYKIQISVLAMVALIAIWASYSRSALLALAISMLRFSWLFLLASSKPNIGYIFGSSIRIGA